MANLTQEELAARLTEIRSRIQEIDAEYGAEALPDEARDEWNRLNEELDAKSEVLRELEARRQRVEELAQSDGAKERGFNTAPSRVRGDDIYDLSTVRMNLDAPEVASRELRDRAMRAVESSSDYAETVSKEDAQSNVARLLDTVDDDQGTLARRILQTGSPIYKRAFGKAVAGATLSHEEQRALSQTTTAGGFAIPFVLDPSVIHTSNYSVNPWRAISRVEQVVGNNWHGITSAGVSAAYGAELTEASDNAPTIAQPEILVEKAQCFVPFSIEIGQDWAGLQSEMTMMIQEAKDDLEATKFGFGAGHGSTEPEGVLVGGTVTYTTAGTAALAVADLYGAEAALPPRHRPNAQWVANRAIYNRVRQFDTAGGAQLWTENLRAGLANNVPTPGNTGYNLLGYQANECSAMGTTIATGGTVAVIGNFSRYVIVDRVGMSVELIPHMFATANNRPSGQRGLYAFWRNSAEVVDPNAFRKIITL